MVIALCNLDITALEKCCLLTATSDRRTAGQLLSDSNENREDVPNAASLQGSTPISVVVFHRELSPRFNNSFARTPPSQGSPKSLHDFENSEYVTGNIYGTPYHVCISFGCPQILEFEINVIY